MKNPKMVLGKIIRSYKAVTTTEIRNVIRDDIEKTFSWQRNYYDRVIRNKQELNNIRRYIRDNPKNWGDDDNYPHKE